MEYYKRFDNGLRLIIKKTEGLFSVASGILVKTGSINEDDDTNGISHFIEHTVFKGTATRSSFDISNYIDSIGAQINAFTSKELTCYYTKSTLEHLENSLEVLSDLFFNSVFDEAELNKEKGVIIEEINMCEDTPEDLCSDVLAESYYGKSALGRTILGSAKNVKSFTKSMVMDYMDKYYTADNVVISISGNVDIDLATKLVEQYFASKFTRLKSAAQVRSGKTQNRDLYKTKKIEQAHISMAFKGYSAGDEKAEALQIANAVLGGGMSSRLFQKVREELGLAYSIYSYVSTYKDCGTTEIYAGVNTECRDLAATAIIDEIRKLKKDGITKEEFARGKEQLKSAFVFGQESTASQMLLYGKSLLFLNKQFDFNQKIKKIESVTVDNVLETIEDCFDLSKMATATVGTKRSPLKVR